MAALIKTNANLSVGGLVVLKRTYGASDGVLSFEVDYVCLPKFASVHTPFFRTGANPITALPIGVAGLAISQTPKLYDFNLKTENGLTFMSAKYAGPLPSSGLGEGGDWTTTTSADIKNVTWTSTRSVGVNVSVPGTTDGSTTFQETGKETVTNSFDYLSYTASSSSTSTPIRVSGRVGSAFNVKGSIYGAGTPKATTVDSSSESKNSKGITTYTYTSTGLYVV